MRPELAGDDAIAAFEREVPLTSQLSHPNTVAIYDVGRTPDGIFYYVMEYLPGIDLETLVLRQGALPARRANHVLRQVCASLAEAHDTGLIHRDVKAANVILCQRGGVPDVVKVVDFGLVRELGGEAQQEENGVSGTPSYLAPEAISDPTSMDARTDLYAVGVLGYWLIAGQLPIEGQNVTHVLSQQLFKEPPPLSQVAEQPVSPELEDALMRCLRKKPSERPRGIRALDRSLARCPEAGTWSDEDARQWWERSGIRGGPPAATVSSATAATLVWTGEDGEGDGRGDADAR